MLKGIAPPRPTGKLSPFPDAEYRFDQRGVGFDIRRHDEDILGKKAGILCKHLQKLIMENFDLAKRAVAGMDPEGMVIFRQALSRNPVFVPVTQIQHVGLQRGQERLLSRLHKGFPDLSGKVRQVSEKVPSLLPQGGEQAVPLLQVKILPCDFIPALSFPAPSAPSVPFLFPNGCPPSIPGRGS